ncbi:MAG TPA: ferritin-like protein [Actinomycetota bacterium]|nr:ferritin-like protein [Actinomycetota bacterium]
MDRRIVIEHRDALVYMLVEAAEIEHAICCQYLFAAFGLKQSVDEGVDERQLRAIERWRATLLEIATQEMLHFALVNNLLAAIGAAPRVGRPNLPVQGRHYPPGVQFALLRLGEPALRHFLYLERPEGITLVDAEGFESLREAEPILDPEDIIPRPQDFSTVGELYRAIEEGFERLVDRYGEEWVFIGDESSQATPETFRWPDLVAVTDLKTARQAIDVVVEQGEGPRGHWRDAHYGRLLVVLGEYLTMKRENPAFEPSRPVVAAHCRQPVDTDAVSLITDPLTGKVMDAFNVSYEILLYTLARYFAHGHETQEQLDTLADVAVGLMIFVIRPLGMALTELPVGDDLPGKTAGPAFELFHGSGYLLPHTWQAWVLLHERLAELEIFLVKTAEDPGAPGALRDVAGAVARLEDKLVGKMERLGGRDVGPPLSSLSRSVEA